MPSIEEEEVKQMCRKSQSKVFFRAFRAYPTTMELKQMSVSGIPKRIFYKTFKAISLEDKILAKKEKTEKDKLTLQKIEDKRIDSKIRLDKPCEDCGFILKNVHYRRKYCYGCANKRMKETKFINSLKQSQEYAEIKAIKNNEPFIALLFSSPLANKLQLEELKLNNKRRISAVLDYHNKVKSPISNEMNTLINKYQ